MVVVIFRWSLRSHYHYRFQYLDHSQLIMTLRLIISIIPTIRTSSIIHFITSRNLTSCTRTLFLPWQFQKNYFQPRNIRRNSKLMSTFCSKLSLLCSNTLLPPAPPCRFSRRNIYSFCFFER